jgi:hypothetical protein
MVRPIRASTNRIAMPIPIAMLNRLCSAMKIRPKKPPTIASIAQPRMLKPESSIGLVPQ